MAHPDDVGCDPTHSSGGGRVCREVRSREPQLPQRYSSAPTTRRPCRHQSARRDRRPWRGDTPCTRHAPGIRCGRSSGALAVRARLSDPSPSAAQSKRRRLADPAASCRAGRHGTFASPTTLVVAPGRQGFSIGTAIAAAWSAICSQPVMSWRISGTPSV
jgi:hypothetical protein